jgi:uncharacterized cofD-like protein
MVMIKKNIVVIGGGTGTFTVLSGLKKYPVRLTAIVSMADDGGSTGLLREEFGILPTGDIRRALVALSSYPEKFLADLFTYRFREGGMNGHNFGNLILTALERVTGGFEEAIAAASRMLDVCGNVIPVTLSDVRLYAMLEDGEVIAGETNIDIPKHNGKLRIERVWLRPKALANPRAVRAIRDADMIVIGPGDLYTSIVPNLLVGGIRNAILKSHAKKVYVANLMTKYGETNNFIGEDFLRVLDTYLAPAVFDAVVINKNRPPARILQKYKKHRAHWVQCNTLVKNPSVHTVRANFLHSGSYLRHDSHKLARVLMHLL